MGHLLATVNPEAAEAIKPAPTAYVGRPPQEGELVQYYARPGEGRAGKMKFPAIVHHFAPPEENSEGIAELTVIYGADDFRTFQRVRKRTHDVPWPAWDFMPVQQDLEQDLTRLIKAVIGEDRPVQESVYDMIRSLKRRMDRIEKKTKGDADEE